MVAIVRDPGVKREYALLADAWPAEFSLIICHEGKMRVHQEMRDVTVAYLNHNLTGDMKRRLLELLINYDDSEHYFWCEQTIDRLIQGDLDTEWLNTTGFVRKIEQELRIKISLIFNFSPNGDTGPIPANEPYPLSIVFSRV